MDKQDKTDAEETVELEIEMDEDRLAALDRIAERKGVSREELVIQILENHLREAYPSYAL